MARSAFMCEVECSIISENGQHPVDPMFIKTIAVDYGYQITYMPIIYIIAKFPNDVYSEAVKGEKTNKIYLRVDRYNAYSEMSINKKFIEGQFTYLVSDSNPNYGQDLTIDTGADQTYHTIKLALFSMEVNNLAKTSFNGIYGEMDQATLITKAVEGLDCVVKPILYNPEFDTIEVPALNSKMKLLEYLYTKCPFYDTNYLFFIDFEKAYLIDLTGEYCEDGTGQLSTVIFDVQEFTQESTYYEGMEEKNGAYFVNVNPKDCNIVPNKGTDKINNQYVFVADDGAVDFVDLEVNSNPDADIKQSFRRGNNPALYKNMAESNTVIIEIVKENIDTSVFTPNKEYQINNWSDYNEYNGKYTLLSKQDYIVNNSGQFGMSTMVKLRKVGNITKVGADVIAKATSRSKSAARRYTTSAGSGKSIPVGSGNGISTPSTNAGGSTPKSSRGSTMKRENLHKLPTVRRIRASTDMSLKRQPRKISGEGN